MARALYVVAAVTATLSCRDERECSELIAKSIVAAAKQCWLNEREHKETHFKACVSDFCVAKCGKHEECTRLCERKGFALEDKVGAFLQIQIANAMDDPDELEELRRANPSAFAIVKALLTKRSLGLLNPAHPSASFADGESEKQADYGAQAEPSSHEAHKDWLNWRPTREDASDDATELPSKTEEASRSPEKPALGAWASIFTSNSELPAHSDRKNPYLANLDFDVHTVERPHKNPYMDTFLPNTNLLSRSTSSYLKDLE